MKEHSILNGFGPGRSPAGQVDSFGSAAAATRRLLTALGLCLGFCAGGVLTVDAQDADEIGRLRQELRAAQERFEQAQREHQRQIEELTRRMDQLSQGRETASKPEAAATNASPADAAARAALERELAAELVGETSTNAASAVASPGDRRTWSPSDPIRLQSGGAYLDVGLVASTAVGTSTADDIAGGTQLGGHDPNQRGFTLQGVELNLAGAVDPYFRGNVNVLYQIDAEGESLLELEEAWMETVSLPANLQVRAGQIYTEFGRQNPTHNHTWATVDTPLVLGRFLGPDGLRNPGARLAWLAPTPFYSEFFLSVQNSQGETASSFRSSGDGHGHGGSEDELPFAYRHAENDRGVVHVQDMLFAPRYALSFDLTQNQVVLLGASAAFGPNSSGEPGAGDTRTDIYGVDLTWKWRSPNHHGGFPFVSFQTEALARRYEAGAFDWDENGDGLVDGGELEDPLTLAPAFLPAETLWDYGFYSQVLYGFRKGWVAGLRFDYLTSEEADYEQRGLLLDGEPVGRDSQRAPRWRLSPNLTWYPSEFSKLRLQYNYDDRDVEGVDHSVWLQFDFLLGSHAAHKF